MAMSVLEERRQEEREQRTRAFIEAGFEEIASVGVEKTTLASVAARARLSKSLIYFYFEDKDALIVSLCNRAKEALLEDFKVARANHKTGRAQVIAIGAAYLAYPQRYDAMWQVMAHVESVIPPPDPLTAPYERSNELGVALLAEVASAVATGREDGTICHSPETPEQVATVLWSMLYGYLRLSQVRGDDIEKICNVRIKDLSRYVLIHATLPLVVGEFSRDEVQL